MTLPHDEYLATVTRLEPDIHPIDASAGYASMAISLRRIADALQLFEALVKAVIPAIVADPSCPPEVKKALTKVLSEVP